MRLCTSFVVLFLFPSLTLAEVNSPVEFHRYLRKAYLAGHKVTPEIQAFVRQTGDHSFDSLLYYSQNRAAGLRLQRVAWQAWDDKDYAHAAELYREAADQLLRERARSEAAFCFYYIAEIHTEQEHFSESLAWLERGLELMSSQDCPYLEALLQQSRGYSLWFTDHLQASVHAFSLALERWQRLHFRVGILATWNNLAFLYEELRLWERAHHCYKEALKLAAAPLEPEIEFLLHANYALFSHKRNRTIQALHHLNRARQFKAVFPSRTLILESQILGTEPRIENLLSLEPDVPSLRVEKALLLGRFFEKQGDKTQAHRYFNQALTESTVNNLRYFMRKTALSLGRWLEANGRYQETAELYFEAFKREENILVPELAFSYSRAVSPLFDGWIRCLIRLGQVDTAWLGIQRLLQIRRAKAANFRKAASQIRYVRNELDQFVVMGKSETEGAVPLSFETIPTAQEQLLYAVPAHLLKGFTTLGMWPDQEKVYVWITRSSGRTFRELTVSEEVGELVRKGVEQLYLAKNSLPAAPPAAQLRAIYNALFRPLEELLDTRAVLFIGHKELQSLPLELLQNQRGEYLLQYYDFSYLPSIDRLRQNLPSTRSAPVMMLFHPSPPAAETHQEEVFFKALFSDITLVRGFENLPNTAGWIHISSHFRLDDRFWLISGFERDAEKLNVLHLLNVPLSSSLLSLGVCDAGNGYSSGSPYWLGFSELFLSQGIGALIVSRWKMGEFSSRIYRHFYALCRQGRSMDQALSQARRDFMTKILRRGKNKILGDHPFFWAGITYIGTPGGKLYEVSQQGPGFLLLGVRVFLLGLLAGTARAIHSTRRGRQP